MGYDFDPVNVPTADSTDDVMMRDVVGKKDDAARTTVGTTRSLMGYLKGLVNELALLNGTGGTVFFGKVTTATSTTRFKVEELSGLGTNLLIDAYYCQVLEADNAAPEGEIQKISAYATSDGDITVGSAFTAAPAVGDYVLIMHESIALQFSIADGSGAYPASVADNSILAHLMAVAGDISDYDNAIHSLEAIGAAAAAIKIKSDLLNSAVGTSTLNDANTSDTIVPGSLPTKMHVVFDISTIIVNNDDFTLEVKVGVSGSERVVAYYKITSDGTDTTIDTGSGAGSKVKARRIDISDILVYTGEQVLLNYTKSSATDRDVLYRYVCGV